MDYQIILSPYNAAQTMPIGKGQITTNKFIAAEADLDFVAKFLIHGRGAQYIRDFRPITHPIWRRCKKLENRHKN